MKAIKLLILIVLSLSVYFIYNYTNKTTKILIVGDKQITKIKPTFSNNKVIINNKYASKKLSTKDLLKKIKLERNIKRYLIESHYLILSIGYNDLVYDLSLEDNINNHHYNKITESIENDYNKLIKEIRKYYKNKIIVIGYSRSKKEDYYLNIGIRKLNQILKNNKEVEDKIINEILAK